jgi:hypothetical protein
MSAPNSLNKIDSLILAIQGELRRHDWDSFPVPVDDDEPDGQKVVVSGCSVCRKQIGTMPQFLDHLADDAIPLLFEKLRVKKVDRAASGGRD